MPYYSVHIHGGDEDRSIASDLRETFRGKAADYTGHPIFYAKNHRTLSEFRALVESMVNKGHEVTVRKITMRQYDWERHQ